LDKEELAVASLVCEKNQPAGSMTNTLPGAQGLYLPVRVEDVCYAVLGIATESKKFDLTFLKMLTLLTQQAAFCLERNKIQNESFDAKLSSETQIVRTMALNAISHDFRTPLTVIGEAADILAAQEKTISPSGALLLNDIKHESNRMNHLVSNVMLLARLETKNPVLHLEWNNLKELVVASLGKLEPQALASRKVIIAIPEETPLLYVDGNLFEQLFLQLFDNSVQHAPEATELKITAVIDKGFISIAVSDDGPGIAGDTKADLSRKFLAGDQRGKESSGLGLLLCKVIVRKHDGDFEIHPGPGGGCEIILPVSDVIS